MAMWVPWDPRGATMGTPRVGSPKPPGPQGTPGPHGTALDNPSKPKLGTHC